MTKENLNTNLGNTDKLSVTSNKLKVLKSAIKSTILGAFLSVVPVNAIAQNTTPTDTIKAKTEIVTNEILSPEEILAKYKISDTKTATIEQLQAVVDEVTAILKKKILTGEKEMSYITFRRKIREQIVYKKGDIDLKKAEEDRLMAEKILKSLQGEKK